MLTRTIKISEETYEILSDMKSGNDTFDDVINFLIDEYNEEFSDEQARMYNESIEEFENGDYSHVTGLTYEELENRIAKLESEIEK